MNHWAPHTQYVKQHELRHQVRLNLDKQFERDMVDI